MKRLTNKQLEALQTIEWFIPDWVKWSTKVVTGLGFRRISSPEKTKQAEDGISPEEAFFLKSERGIDAPKVTDLGRLEALLWGQRWMAAQIKMWKQGLRDGVSLPSDFVDEPPYIQKLVKRTVFEGKTEVND